MACYYYIRESPSKRIDILYSSDARKRTPVHALFYLLSGVWIPHYRSYETVSYMHAHTRIHVWNMNNVLSASLAAIRMWKTENPQRIFYPLSLRTEFSFNKCQCDWYKNSTVTMHIAILIQHKAYCIIYDREEKPNAQSSEHTSYESRDHESSVVQYHTAIAVVTLRSHRLAMNHQMHAIT